MPQVDIEEAKTSLPALIDAAVQGEEVLIVKDEEHVVRPAPVSRAKRAPRFGSAAGLITMADDFDEPLEDFEE